LNTTQTAADFLIKSYNKSFITNAVHKRDHERTSEPRITSLLHQTVPHDGLWVIPNNASRSFFGQCFVFERTAVVWAG
jgi:hypothetical protein